MVKRRPCPAATLPVVDSRRRLLIGIGLLAPFTVYSASASPAGFDHDHAAWTELLRRHVAVGRGGSESRFRYAGLAADRSGFDAYLRSLSAVTARDFEGWTRDQRLAFLINAYNAFTIAKILTRYPGLRSIRDFGSIIGNPWKDRFFMLLGRPRHLDEIEHELIRAPGAFDEPRIHFAVNCAAVGCPMLREEAYVAKRLAAQLDEQATRFLSDRSRNRVAGDSLELSRIFDWYGQDFLTARSRYRDLQDFLAQHASSLSDTEADREALKSRRLPVRFLEYDWSLNDAGR